MGVECALGDIFATGRPTYSWTITEVFVGFRRHFRFCLDGTVSRSAHNIDVDNVGLYGML